MPHKIPLDPTKIMRSSKFYLIVITAITLNILLCGCGGSSYEAGSQARANISPIANADDINVDEDDTVFFNLTVNDIDENQDKLTAKILSNPSNGFIRVTGGGHSYEPIRDFNGIDSFVYEVSDGYGGFATSTVTIHVSAVNDAPIAQDDSFTTDEDTPLSIDVLANDSDVDADQLSIKSLNSITGGQAVITANKLSILITPDQDSIVPMTLNYTITDGNGETASANLTVNINSLNDAPVAVADEYFVQRGKTVTIPVLENDYDVDGDFIKIIDFSPPPYGSVSLIDNGFQVVPEDDIRPISFNYTISDLKGLRSTATVVVNYECSSYTEKVASIEMICISSGTFTMGSPVTEFGRFINEGPQHRVNISKDFELGKFEITQSQWLAVMGSPTPSISHSSGNQIAAFNISWNDITEVNGFLDKLNMKTPGCDTSQLNTSGSRYHPNNVPSGCYRLPTEAEWEYSARADSNTRYSFGDQVVNLEQYAWYRNNSFDGKDENDEDFGIHVGGQKLPNTFGLFDMHGNLSEWVFDSFSFYSAAESTDPVNPDSAFNRLRRGGSWTDRDTLLRSANRSLSEPGENGRSINTGFRILRER